MDSDESDWIPLKARLIMVVSVLPVGVALFVPWVWESRWLPIVILFGSIAGVAVGLGVWFRRHPAPEVDAVVERVTSETTRQLDATMSEARDVFEERQRNVVVAESEQQLEQLLRRELQTLLATMDRRDRRRQWVVALFFYVLGIPTGLAINQLGEHIIR